MWMIKRVFVFGVVLVLSLLFFCSFAAGGVTVGVKVGDWIEYTVLTTGDAPQVQNVQWARMDIIGVQGSEIKVNVTTQGNDGAFYSQIMDLDPEEGQIGAWFIIPANLTVGDDFYDINLGRNVTIEGQEQKNYAGAVRTIINATTPERIKDWDKETGIFLKSIDTLPGYTINATAIKTNMWSPQILGLGYVSLVVVIVGAVVLAIVAVIGVVWRHHRLAIGSSD